VTFDTQNYLYNKGCGGESSQLFTSVLQSNGTWIVKSVYLGTGECLQDMGGMDPVGFDTYDGGTDQKWVFTEAIGSVVSSPTAAPRSPP
jgi:hypothetical protein